MEGVSSKDKRLHLEEGGYHELFFEPQCAGRIRAAAKDWILQHAQSAAKM